MAIPEPVLSFFSGHQRTRPHLVNEPQKAIRSHSCRYRYNGKSGKKQKKKKELGEPTRYRYRHFIDLSAVEASTLHPIRGPLFI